MGFGWLENEEHRPAGQLSYLGVICSFTLNFTRAICLSPRLCFYFFLVLWGVPRALYPLPQKMGTLGLSASPVSQRQESWAVLRA